MTRYGYHFAGMQPAGTAATDANTGADCYTSGGGSAVFTATGILFTNSGSGSNAIRALPFSGAPVTDLSSRCRFRTPPAGSSDMTYGVHTLRGTGRTVSVYYAIGTGDTTHRILMMDYASGYSAWLYAGLQPDTDYDICLQAHVVGVGTGSLGVALYLGGTNTVVQTASTAPGGVGNSTTLTNYNLGAVAQQGGDAGITGGISATSSIEIQDLQFENGLVLIPPWQNTLPLAGIIDSTGWSAVLGTTIEANLADTDPATGAQSSANPSNLVMRTTLPGLFTPAGDFIVATEGYRAGGATAGSMTGYLYEGATLRATSNTASFTATNGAVPLTFTAANIAAITAGAWNSGLELRLSVSAS